MNWYSDNKDKIVIILLLLVILLITGLIIYWLFSQSQKNVPFLIPSITMTQNSAKNKPSISLRGSKTLPPSAATTQELNQKLNQKSKINQEQSQLDKILMSTFERKLIDIVNDYRASKSMTPLLIDKRLMQSAKNHNDLMAQQDILSHGLPDELPLADPGTNNDRYDNVGYDWKYAAENVASGHQTPEQVMNGWINSPGHNANILSTKSRDIGVAYNPKGNYWTQNFGNSFSPNQPIE